jgi:hypothetical protein
MGLLELLEPLDEFGRFDGSQGLLRPRCRGDVHVEPPPLGLVATVAAAEVPQPRLAPHGGGEPLDGDDLARVKLGSDRIAQLQRIVDGADDFLLGEAARVVVDDVEAEVRRVLEGAKLPLRLARPILSACSREPHRSAFGISQALTAHAQDESPEVRLQLEDVAAVLKTKVKGNPKLSAYNFRSKAQERRYEADGVLPKGIAVIYNDDAVRVVLAELGS